ncbi:ribonuclease [Pasteurellaceae bacterium 15-036681]|nr:ribonuclease [Pasteurellaceae bacterium 15-036681]
MKKKNNQTSKQRTLQQGIFLIIIIAFAIFTWFNNEEKASPSAKQQTSNTQTATQSAKVAKQDNPQLTTKVASATSNNSAAVPESLGNYDTVMANDNLGQNKNADVDYYMLALSWSPNFCAIQRKKYDGSIPKHLQFQCGNAQQFGWVIHGLWPQSAKARNPSQHPRFCRGDLAPVPEALIKSYMIESPGASLLQGQWEKHGACAFDNAAEYFAKQRELYLDLKLPTQELNRKELFQWMRQNNAHIGNAYLGASKNELYVCYDKNWRVIDCQR